MGVIFDWRFNWDVSWFSTSITGGYTQGSENVNFTNKKEVGNPKSFSETVANYSKLLSPFN